MIPEQPHVVVAPGRTGLDDTSGGPLAGVRTAFTPVPGYLNAATMGLPPTETAYRLRMAVTGWQLGEATAAQYDEDVRRARQAYARLVSVPPSWVAVGAQASVQVGLVAASLPDDAEVVAIEDDFTSVLFPFLAQRDRGVSVRLVPLQRLADSIDAGTTLVAFSLAQSASGVVCDAAAVREAARRVGALTLCDLTQAAGWLPVAAGDFDVTVCAAYKWLCQPRGVAYLTVRPEVGDRLRPVYAGWYAGQDVWGSCYGPGMRLAGDARRFDVSPAWLCFAGAVPAMELFASVPTELIRDFDCGLADELRSRLGLPAQRRPVVVLDDPTGAVAARLSAAGAVVSSRAGRVRIAFHVWNTRTDVDLAASALLP
ncbi:MAG TPA: aminotransferase class V-fold PLP-dependent enzyme [Dermatophilaceae bacterium]|nr:aminotransferase class V-fold PLP-dependent enzyme [Dermatophilaceae bacterium]